MASGSEVARSQQYDAGTREAERRSKTIFLQRMISDK